MSKGVRPIIAEPNNGFQPIRILLKRRGQWIACFLLICGVALAWTLSKKPYYEAVARVELTMGPPRSDRFGTNPAFLDDLYFINQCELLQSHQFMARVMARVTEKRQTGHTNLSHGEGDIADSVGDVKFKTLLHLYCMDIVGIAEKGEEAAALVNQVAAALVELSAMDREEENERIISQLENQIEKYEEEIQNHEDMLSKFRLENLITKKDDTLMAAQLRIEDLEETLMAMHLKHAALEIKTKHIQKRLADDRILIEYDQTLPEIESSPVIIELKQQINLLEQQEPELAHVYLPGHIKLKTIRRTINDLKSTLRDYERNMLQELLESTKDIYTVNARKMRLLDGLMWQQKKTGVKLFNRHQIYLERMSGLETVRRFKSECEAMLWNFSFDVGISKPPVTIWETAHVPTQPVALNKSYKIASTTLFALIFSVVLVLALEQLSSPPDQCPNLHAMQQPCMPMAVFPPRAYRPVSPDSAPGREESTRPSNSVARDRIKISC